MSTDNDKITRIYWFYAGNDCMKEQYRCVRLWTLGKVWEDLSLEVTGGGLQVEKGDYEDSNLSVCL